MISAYSTRKKLTIKTPQSKAQFFSMFQLHCNEYNHCASLSPINNQQINSGKSFRKLTSFPILSENNIDKKTNNANQSQIKSVNICSAIKSSEILQDQILPCEINLEIPRNTHEIMNASSASLFPNFDISKPKQKPIEAYCTKKKSYRNHMHEISRCVPYRKCQSFMEEKIVNIINKMKAKKSCQKQIETLLYKCKYVPLKELRNPYFVSGIITIQNIMKKQLDLDKQQILNKINGVIEEIKKRIYEELDCIRYFEIDPNQRSRNKPIFDQGVLIRKAYNISKKKKTGSKQIIRQQAIQIVQRFLASQPTSLAVFWGELCKL